MIDEGSKLILVETDASAFIFNNGKITGLTEYGKTLSDIVIPTTINGISVTGIGYEAFYNCDSLTSIEIPNSVTSIGDEAFYNCSSLTIYWEAQSQPSGWSSGWNYYNGPVIWGYDG